MRPVVMIIGGAGFIGANLATQLVATYDVVLIDNLIFSSRPTPTQNIRFYQGDVNNLDFIGTWINVEKPAHIIWCVDYFIYSPVGPYPVMQWSWINHCLARLLTLVGNLAKKPHFYLMSSELVYEPSTEPITEEGQLSKSTSPHLHRFLAAERHTRSICEYFNVPYTIFRLSTVVGERLYVHPGVDIFSFLIDLFIVEKQLTLTNPERRRDYISVEAAMVLMVKVIKAKNKLDCYNISSGVSVSNREVVNLIINQLQPGYEAVVNPGTEGDLVLDPTRVSGLVKNYKFKPIVDQLNTIIAFRKNLTEVGNAQQKL